MAETIEYVLNINVNKSISTLREMKLEMKEVQKSMAAASAAGNTSAYDKLSKRFIELRDNSEDLNAKLQPMDKQIGILTSSVGALAQIGTGLATVFGADSKSAEELFKTFAKAQAVMQVVNGMNQMQDLLGKLPAAIEATSTALKAMGKAAYTSLGPWGLLAVAIIAVIAAVGTYIIANEELSDSEKEIQAQTEANNEVQKKSIDIFAEKQYQLEQLGKTINNHSTSNRNLKTAIEELSKATGFDITVIKDRNKQIEIANRLVPMQIELIKMEAQAQAAKELYIETLKKQLNTQDKIDKSTPGIIDQIWNSITTFSMQSRVMKNVNTGMENYNDITAENERSLKAFNEIVEDSNYLSQQQKDLIAQVATNYGLQEIGAKKATKAIQRNNEELQKLTAKRTDILKESSTEEIAMQQRTGELTLQQQKDILNKRLDAEEQYTKSSEEQLTDLWNTGKIGWTEYNDAIEQLEFDRNQRRLQGAAQVATGLKNILMQSMQNELDAAEGNAQRQAQIRKSYQDKIKASAIAEAVINGAVGITNIWSSWAEVPVVAALLTALEVAAIGVQVQTINQQQFAKGGLIGGPQHNAGGVNINAEGGEFIASRKTTAQYYPVLKSMNDSANNNTTTQLIDYDLLASKINDKKVVIVSSEMSIQQSKDNKIKVRAQY